MLASQIATSHYLNQCWQDLQRHMASLGPNELTHWGLVTHTCISELTIIASDNGLLLGCRQTLFWTRAYWYLGTNFSEIIIEIHTFSLKKMHLKMPSGNLWPFFLGLNVLNQVTATYLRLDTCRFHLRVPNLQMSCRDLTTWQGSRIVAQQWLSGHIPSLYGLSSTWSNWIFVGYGSCEVSQLPLNLCNHGHHRFQSCWQCDHPRAS